MKFAITFGIGDTEMHNQLYSRFGNQKAQNLYCHCNCPINWIRIYSKNIKKNQRQLFLRVDLDQHYHSIQQLKLLSYCPVQFFSSNELWYKQEHYPPSSNPGEKLCMHQLGVTKRALTYFVERFCRSKKSVDHIKTFLAQLRFSSDYLSFLLKRKGIITQD